MPGCRTGSCRPGSRATSCNALLCFSALGIVHADGRTAEGCVELAYSRDEPICLCRQDFRLVMLQNADTSGVTEFGLQILMGLLCPVRVALDMRSAGIRSHARK